VARVQYAMKYRPKNSFSMSHASRKVFYPGVGACSLIFVNLGDLPVDFWVNCSVDLSVLVKVDCMLVGLFTCLLAGQGQLASLLAHRLHFAFVDFARSVLVISGEAAIALIALPMGVLMNFSRCTG